MTSLELAASWSAAALGPAVQTDKAQDLYDFPS